MYEYDNVMEVVNYVLAGHNITETSTHFGIIKRDIIAMLDEIRIEGKEYYNEELSKQIEDTLTGLTSKARALAGSISKREEVLDEDDVIDILFHIIFYGSTTRELAILFDCSSMTISNAIKRLNCPKIMQIVGDVRIMRNKRKKNLAFSYVVFRWLFSPQKISEIQDEKALAILQTLYIEAIENFGFKQRISEDAWKR